MSAWTGSIEFYICILLDPPIRLPFCSPHRSVVGSRCRGVEEERRTLWRARKLCVCLFGLFPAEVQEHPTLRGAGPRISLDEALATATYVPGFPP